MTDEEAIKILETEKGLCCGKKKYEAIDCSISALRDRIARQNPQPLTLDELRGMGGEPQPVYLVSERYAEGNGWKICHGMTDNGMIDFGDEAWAAQVFDEGYVIAYRTKPEPPEREANDG